MSLFNFHRSERSEVLSEDLQTVEKRVELVKTVVQITSRKVAGSLQSSAGMDVEKRLVRTGVSGESVTSNSLAETITDVPLTIVSE